ncbi:MAG TPA: hypothetical protein VNC18_13010 [Gemmatimonadaceae bacterium]|jgi:hypothetical protein|nr:hypothetical protein [Gemmatimonadaceae bacterium]
MTEQSFDEWSSEERERLAEVGQHRSPRAELRDRTTDALRERGLLGAGGSGRMPGRFFFALAAAAVVVFTAGLLAGYGVGLRHQTEIRRDSVTTAGGGPAREVARLDSPATQAPASVGGRHVIWF